MEEPIKSQEEANQVRDYLIHKTQEVLKIDRDQATKRIDALFASGLLHQFSGPYDPKGQIAIELFLQIPR